MKMMELKECEYGAPCAVCDRFTEWRMIAVDFHVCPGPCYRTLEQAGFVEIVAVMRAEGRLPLEVECQPAATLH